METSGAMLTIIGFAFWFGPMVLIHLGKLRNANSLSILLVIHLLLLAYGIFILDECISYASNNNVARVLFCPFIYISLFALLRMIFWKVYELEPDMAHYSRYSRFDNRKINFFDGVVFLLPILVSILPLAFSSSC